MAKYQVTGVFFDNLKRYAPDTENNVIEIDATNEGKLLRYRMLGYIGDVIPEKRKGRKVKHARVAN